MSDSVFIQVGALADGFAPDSYALARYPGLAGQTLTLHFGEQEAIACRFESDEILHWGPQRVAYRATSIRPGIVLVDFLVLQAPRPSVTLVCCLDSGCFSAVFGALPDRDQVAVPAFQRATAGMPLTAVEAEIRSGTLNRPWQPQGLHQHSRGLVGLRNLYHYSPTERYEHIYLNDGFYAWHCLEGVEKGLADVERCQYLAISEQLWLFVWQEKVVPTLGVVLIDMDNLRTDGKILGYQGSDFDALSNFPMGARIEVLNRTDYPVE